MLFLANGFRFGSFQPDSAAWAVAARVNIAQYTNSVDRELFTAIPPTKRGSGREKEPAAFIRHNKGGEYRRSVQRGPGQFATSGGGSAPCGLQLAWRFRKKRERIGRVPGGNLVV